MLNSVVVRTLASISSEVYYVGGFVRDLLLGRPSKDVDIATDIPYQEVINALKGVGLNPVVINQDLNVVQVKEDGIEFEIARFRTESYPKGGSLRPESYNFIRDVVKDLERRDFTINAIALHVQCPSAVAVEEYLVDPFFGVADIKAKALRAVGYNESYMNGLNRFKESPVRIMRGHRFVAQLGFQMDLGTFEAVKECSPMLSDVAKVPTEQVAREFLKLLASPYASEGVRSMQRANTLGVVLPEMAHLPGHEQNPKYHTLDAFDHTLQVLDGAVENGEDLPMLLSTFLHDCAKGIYKNTYYVETYSQQDMPQNDLDHDDRGADLAYDICVNKFQVGKDVAKQVRTLVKFHMIRCSLERASFVRFVRKVASHCTSKNQLKEMLERLIRHKTYDNRASKVAAEGDLIKLENLYKSVIDSTYFYPHEMMICGKDVINLIPEYDQKTHGKMVGDILRRCLLLIQQHPERNSVEELTSYVEKQVNVRGIQSTPLV